MLIEFHVKNFRSLRDEQVFSLVASKDKTLQDTNTQATGIHAAPSVVRSAVIYGANASGKSNLIKALQCMREVVTDSATNMRPGQPFPVQPFRLDADFADQPSEFEVTFLRNGVRYQYGFAMTAQRIVSEHLLVYQTPKPQRWFKRHFDPDTGKDVYDFGSGLEGPKHLWESATRPNALFLSVAVQFNSETLRPVFDWFEDRLIVFDEHARLSPQASIEMLEQADGRKNIRNLLLDADTGIADIDVETVKVQRLARHFDPESGEIQLRPKEEEKRKLRFHHATERGHAVFDWMDESDGTRKLLHLAGPVLNILAKGLTLVVDELDTSLHPLLVCELVRLFHRPETNTGNAQLVFTTHDTSLLDATNLFRRDQIWIVEKDRDQASALVGLSEFSPRKNEALERGYLTGRYGGVPFLSDSLGLER